MGYSGSRRPRTNLRALRLLPFVLFVFLHVVGVIVCVLFAQYDAIGSSTALRCRDVSGLQNIGREVYVRSTSDERAAYDLARYRPPCASVVSIYSRTMSLLGGGTLAVRSLQRILHPLRQERLRPR